MNIYFFLFFYILNITERSVWLQGLQHSLNFSDISIIKEVIEFKARITFDLYDRVKNLRSKVVEIFSNRPHYRVQVRYERA